VTFDACTIIAQNYLPQARVLARSFTEHHPGSRLAVLLLDDHGQGVGASEPFEVMRLSDIPETPEELQRMAAIYDVLELATAVKPWLLQLLLSRGATAAMYLDPDMRVYAPLDDLFESAITYDLVLTPHVTSPVPRDGRMVEETSLLAAGMFNLGFCAVGQGAQPFLAYWKARLRREGVSEPSEMRFVDQRWVDFVPGMFPCHVLADRGVNVAYWNLDDRPVEHKGEDWLAGTWPLRLFHFSGYSPAAPHLLSKHQGALPRILLSQHPALADLCAAYDEELVAAGFGAGPEPLYGFGAAANGLVLDRTIRRILRQAILQAENGDGPLPPDPFDRRGAEELLAFLNAPPDTPEDPGHLSLYLGTLYARSTRLYRVFPDPQAGDRERYLEWARREVAAGRIDARLVPPRSGDGGWLGFAGETWGDPADLRPGFLVAGHLAADDEPGEDGRRLLGVLGAAGVPHDVWLWPSIRRGSDRAALAPRGPGRRDWSINLVEVPPDRVDAFVAKVGPGFFAGRYSIGRWFVDLDAFPAEWSPSFAPFWEIWVPSAFSRQVVAEATDKHVAVVPPPIVPPPATRGVDREALGLPVDRPVFVCAVDLEEVFERTNPDGVVDAFRLAFPPGEGPVLAVLAANADHCLVEAERLRHAAAGRRDVVIVDEPLGPDGRAAFVAAGDAYVSLHRSTAFDMAAAGAMALGKPVVATAYGGNLEYMTPSVAHLVPYEVARVPTGCAPYREGSRWAEPDLDAAVGALRQVASDPQAAAALGASARRHVEEEHGLEARVAVVAARFAAITAGREGAERPSGAGGRPLPDLLRGAGRRLRRSARVLLTGRADG